MNLLSAQVYNTNHTNYPHVLVTREELYADDYSSNREYQNNLIAWEIAREVWYHCAEDSHFVMSCFNIIMDNHDGLIDSEDDYLRMEDELYDMYTNFSIDDVLMAIACNNYCWVWETMDDLIMEQCLKKAESYKDLNDYLGM